jgi:alpha-L-arabinofuranosidase
MAPTNLLFPSKTLVALIGIYFVFACSEKNPSGSVLKNIEATIDIQSKGEPISPKMYGMFLEHLGNADVGDLIDDCLWAEILDDRKFFYPVDFNKTLEPINKRDTINQWSPLDHEDAVLMDSVNPFVGIHSPRISTNKQNPEGIVQQGFSVRTNTKYVGRIIMKGNVGLQVKVSLKWGKGEADKSTITFDQLSGSFSRYNFVLESKADTDRASFEITGLGDGQFSVGAVSLMPEGNLHGFRPEVIKLLNDLNSSLYRWGGNMSSGYDWRDGIGDPDKRPPRYEYAWEAMENNDVGTHELMKFAELINVELCMTVNAGLGDANSAAQWVEYINGTKDSAMGKIRTANGHPDPFGIKLWCVGNESYGWWQLGHTDLISYSIKYNMFAEKMLAVDPTISLVASGATLDEMTITESALKLTGTLIAEYDSPSDWTGGMLRQGKNISYMSEHFYCSVDGRFDLKAGKYVNIAEPLVDWTLRPANRVLAKVQHYKEYRKRIPGSEKIPVYMDEWAYFTNWVHPTPTLGVTIGYARALHEMFRHTDLIKMSGFTFGTSCLSFNDTDVVLNSSGLLFKLYQSQLGTIPVNIFGNSPQPAPQYPIGGDQPTINAGGDTYPLDMVAALTEDRKALTIALVNPTESEQKIIIQLKGIQTSGKIKRWTLSGSSIMARNVVGKAPEIKIIESMLDIAEELTIAPASINIYRYELE